MLVKSPKGRRPKSQNRPDIFGYHDYRGFLRDWLDFLKSTTRGFSLRKLCDEMEVSPALLSLLINGQRHVSEKALQKMVGHLGLSQVEKEYLKLLWELATTFSIENRTAILEKLQHFAGYKKLNAKEVEVFRYMSRWYYIAIREMATYKDFKMDPEWISDQLRKKVTTQQILEALNFLTKSGFIQVNENGSAAIPTKDINCLGSVYSIALREYHSQMIQIGRESLEYAETDERYFLGHSFAIKMSDIDQIKKVIDRALAEISEIHKKSENRDSIYHVEFGIFPLATKRDIK